VAGIINFPRRVGTAEEFLYLLGIPAAPRINRESAFPVILTGPKCAEAYLQQFALRLWAPPWAPMRKARYQSSS